MKVIGEENLLIHRPYTILNCMVVTHGSLERMIDQARNWVLACVELFFLMTFEMTLKI